MHARFHRWLYFTAQRLRGEAVGEVLRDLERSQHWPRERLLALQWERQQAIARHAFATVPWYREQWTRAGVAPDDLRSPADWRRLPVLGKEELRVRGEALHSSRPLPGLKSSTSGSSGTPIAVERNHLSWAHSHANIFRNWRWHGIRPGDRYAYLWGLALDASGRRQAALRDWFFNRERQSAFSLGPETARAFLERLRARPAAFALGYPSAVTHFADEVLAQGLDGHALGLRAVMTTAEVLRPEQRERLTRAFGCRVVDSYGCAETGIAGMECERGGMHVPVESVVVDLEPTADGRTEILLTDLFNVTQPIIRYRIGDLVEAAPDRCPCGRELPLLGRIEGRAGDFLTLPDGRRINGLLPYYIFRPHAKSGEVREYQFVEFPGGRIELRVLPGEKWDDDARALIEREVTEGLGVPVSLRVVDAIRRMGRGKHRDFVKAADLGE
jgi:phenylacetate-CoA ligase